MTAPNVTPRPPAVQRRWAAEQRRIAVYNTTNETIKKFSCCELVSAKKEGSKFPKDTDGYFSAFAEVGQPVFLIGKPSFAVESSDPSRYVFTCEQPIAPYSFGAATTDFPLVCASLCTNDTNHKTLGPQVGKWTLGAGNFWKLLSHDPTHAVKDKTEDGKTIHSVIIAPNLEEPIEQYEYPYNGAWPSGTTQGLYTVANTGVFEIWLNGSPYPMETVDNGAYMLVAVVLLNSDGEASRRLLGAWRIFHKFEIDSVEFNSIECLSAKRLVSLTKGDQIAIQNLSSFALSTAEPPGVGVNEGSDGFLMRWGIRLIRRSFSGDDSGLGETDCMVDAAEDNRVIEIPEAEEDPEIDPPVSPPGGPPGGSPPPGTGFPPPPDGDGDEEEGEP